MKCSNCTFDNVDGTRYCQRCGTKLKIRVPLFDFGWKNSRYSAGAGQKGSSMAPLGAMAVEKQANSLGNVKNSKNLVKVHPLKDGSWYCPDCGELNAKYTLNCKGCGRDFR